MERGPGSFVSEKRVSLAVDGGSGTEHMDRKSPFGPRDSGYRQPVQLTTEVRPQPLPLFQR